MKGTIAAAKSVKRTHLELGGKAPVIVYDDADLDAVVNGLKAFGYYNAGQDCTAACRVYAGKKVYDNLVADLSSAVKNLHENDRRLLLHEMIHRRVMLRPPRRRAGCSRRSPGMMTRWQQHPT